MTRRSSSRRAQIALVVVATLAVGLVTTSTTAAPPDPAPRIAAAWRIFKFPVDQPACTGLGFGATYFTRVDCGFGDASMTGVTATETVQVAFTGPGATDPFLIVPATVNEDTETIGFRIAPDDSWPAGEIRVKALVDGVPASGETSFFHNQLDGAVTPESGVHATGSAVPFEGVVHEVDEVSSATQRITTGVPATFSLHVVTPEGEHRGPYGPFTAAADGTFSGTLPAEATAGLTATSDSEFEVALGVELVDVSYTDPATGPWAAESAGAGVLTVRAAPTTLFIDNSYVSPVGWVKPGETYPFRVFVKNYRDEPESGAVVALPPVDGLALVDADPLAGSGTASILGDGSVRWEVGEVGAATDAGPTVKTLVVRGRADALDRDPQVVWKDLSTTATLTYDGEAQALRSTTRGPKVIPPAASFDTARFGLRPFPVVPVDFFDRSHEPDHSGAVLDRKLNSPEVEGSTFSLFQEMSFGQLAPQGAVPSAALATASWDNPFTGRYKDTGFAFTDGVSSTISGAPLEAGGTCRGASLKDIAGTPSYEERIVNGWYRLPGTTDYYGDDAPGSTVPLAIAGVPFGIDQACGVIGKAVYDAAHIADPEIDYSDFDTDKDGIVDFFMMVYTGAGGNGVSQTSVPPYDNIWPHSFSLEAQFVDEATGLTGYVSDDQLKDLEGRPLFYVDDTFTEMTTAETERPVYVRVGPYNVNPETAIDHASVISHEYGHSLGLPDFYSFGGRETYGDWNLMGIDKSQHMDVFTKQEMGWLVPRELPAGASTVTGWQDSKRDTHRIDWRQPDGTPYALSGPDVHNGEAYVANLPGRQLIDPDVVKAKAEDGPHVWWSGATDESGCAPEGGHNLDIVLPDLINIDPGTPITLRFNSSWDIEWDFDHGFVMTSTDGGETFTSHPSAKGYTTNENPNHEPLSPLSSADCQDRYGNGITGSSGSFAAGTQDEDRGVGVAGASANQAYPPVAPFLVDEYDLGHLAGKASIVRFSYATDPFVTRPGWFIDDVEITAGDRVIYSSDFEKPPSTDVRLTNGGCDGAFQTAEACTPAWTRLSAEDGASPDRAYYLEMRDRSGFDLDGRGENDRAPLDFDPGLLLTFTDEIRGYGNTNSTGAPAQSPLDSRPTPRDDTPDLTDAAFTEVAGDSAYSDFGAGHTDNYTDPDNPIPIETLPGPLRQAGPWVFAYDCLSFEVTAMSGRGIGPLAVPGDLVGDVAFDLGPGCRPFDFGAGDVGNGVPVAVAQAKVREAPEGSVVGFDGSGSFDDRQTSRELAYAWDFDGDGATDATGEVVSHLFPQDGTFDVGLTVTDADGASSSTTVPVRITNVTPVVAASGPESADAGVPVTYRATVTDPGSADRHSYTWRIDGVVVPGEQGPELVRRFDEEGTYGITAAASDEASTSTESPAVVTEVRRRSAGSLSNLRTEDRSRRGYRMVASDGGIFAFGDAGFFGSTGDVRLNKPIVGMASTPSGQGYRMVASDGGIFTFGDAGFFGSTGDLRLNKPIVGMASSPSARGYWLVASDGGIFAFGDAEFFGSTGDLRLNKPIVGMAATPSGEGYWLVASDGGVFTFGDAGFFGSTGDLRLNKSIVGMAATPSSEGYWLVASDGGVFTFGDAGFHGSTGNLRLVEPIVGIATTGSGDGYWLVAGDGGVFAFGDAPFLGSTGGQPLNRPVVGLAQ